MRLRKVVALITGAFATLLSLLCSASAQSVGMDNIRESATWMGSCDNATIWALVAFVCSLVLAWKDAQVTRLTQKLLDVSTEVTKAMQKQTEAYEDLCEAIKEFRSGQKSAGG